jgi:hypothetical protein
MAIYLLQLIQFTKEQFGMSSIEARLSYITMQHEDKIDIIIFQHITLWSDKTLDTVRYLMFSSGANENESTRSLMMSRTIHLTTQLNIPTRSNLLLWECWFKITTTAMQDVLFSLVCQFQQAANLSQIFSFCLQSTGISEQLTHVCWVSMLASVSEWHITWTTGGNR